MKFFRKIRFKYFAEKKISKYLLYALGEIILVVIGILIALAANNYNEQEKAKEQSTETLKEMLLDLESDTTYLSKMIPALSNQIDNESWLIEKKQLDFSDLDSIKLAVKNIKWTYEINDRTFKNILNSSGSRLIGYEDLYKDISMYYIQTKGKIDDNNQLDFQKNIEQSDFDQVINENIFIDNKQYDSYTGVSLNIDLEQPNIIGDYNKIIESLKLIKTKNSLNDKYARHYYQYLELFFCDVEAKKLIKLISESVND